MTRTGIAVRALVSAGVSLLILCFLLRLTLGQGDHLVRPHLLRVLADTAPLFVALYAACALLQAYIRARRYRLLLTAGGESGVPGILHMQLVVLVRNMLVDLLPARIGELSYVAMLNRGYRVKAETCISSLAVSFAFDLVALAMVVALLLAAQLLGSGAQPWALALLGMLCVVALALLACLFVGVRLVTAIATRIMGRASRSRFVRWGLSFLEQLVQALDSTRRAGVLARVIVLSLLVRTVKYASLFCLFHAVVRNSLPELANASPLQTVLALVGGEAASSLPIPALMSFGAYEAGGAATFTLLGFSAGEAVVGLLALHILSQIIDYSIGGLAFIAYLFVTGPQPRVARRTRPATLLMLGAAAALVAAGVGLTGLQYRRIGKMGALTAPGVGQPLQPPGDEHARLQRMTRDLNGFIVWSSNRFGNHDIVKLSLPDLRISRLTDHPHVDYFARVSPDGRRVVFSRSQVEWVSQRNTQPWDVYLVDLETGEEKLVARNGNTPTWSEDGKQVLFQRNVESLVAHDLETGEERVLFEAGKGGVSPSVIFHTPSYSATRAAMAVTLRGSRNATAIYGADGSETRIAGGCQLTWDRDGAYLYWVEGPGRLKNAIWHREFPAGERRLWLDLPGEHSHEYFPRVANKGGYLVLGASTGGRHGHEHDAADYEIFLWRIGTRPEDAVRVTYHTGNDCWPDIYLR